MADYCSCLWYSSSAGRTISKGIAQNRALADPRSCLTNGPELGIVVQEINLKSL